MAFENFRPQLARRDGIQIADGHTDIHAYSHTDRHTYIMENGAKQTLGQDEASREAGLEAMEIGVDAMENGAKQTLG